MEGIETSNEKVAMMSWMIIKDFSRRRIDEFPYAPLLGARFAQHKRQPQK
jgi:hypothetical protein